MVAMAGMFLTGDPTFASLGVATILVVAVAVLGSLTVLPALLSRLGDNVDRLRVPFVGRLAATTARAGSGARSSTASCAGPLLSARRSPAGSCSRSPCRRSSSTWPTPGPDTFPKSLAVVKTYDRMQQAFPGTALPANVVVKAPNVNAPAVRARDRAGSSSGRSRAADARSRSRSTSTRPARSRTSPSRSRARAPTPPSNASLAALRNEIVPQTVGALPTREAGVTGLTAAVEGRAATS